MRRSESGSKGSIQEDAIEMRTEVDNLIESHDIESHNAPPCTATSKSWWSCSSSSTSSYADLVSYFGIRGIIFIVLLKVVAIVAFAMIFIRPSNIDSGDYSQVSLVTGRPENLRTLIHTTSKNAAMADKRSLFTLPIESELIYEKYIEFILSYPRNMNSDAAADSGMNWQETKDSISTLDRMSSALEIATIRAGDREIGGDPLSISTMDPALIVHRFAHPQQQQQQQDEEKVEDVTVSNNEKTDKIQEHKESVNTMEYSIVLNKFNTVMDHCLLVSDHYLPQLLPLTGAELELWHWTLLQTRAVGFYNSNLLAGASQAHRHVQFVPGDALWKLRNADATHALPIDDVIMPKIEAGKWRPYPYAPTEKSSKEHYYHPAVGTEMRLHYESGLLHQLPQFDFQHAVAVLLDRSAFLQYAHPQHAYAEYLQHIYESLLLFNGLNIEDLRLCAHDQMDLFPDSPSSQRRTQATDDDLVPEGDIEVGISSAAGAHTGGSLRVAPTAVKVRRVDCLADVGYNLILRPQYMLLVPRGRKDFAGVVSVNSFGYLGMFLATSEVAQQLIKDVGPLTVLKSTGRELTQRTLH